MDSSRIIVVGGHTRNIGKTALVVDIIRAIPEARWTAAKITQYGHGVCSINGERCGCAPADHAFSITEETRGDGGCDTGRFLEAGARHVYWVRTKQGQLPAAMPALREALAGSRNVIVESNTLLGLIRPRLYLAVLDPRQQDFKESAQRYLDLVDAFVFRAAGPGCWPGISRQVVERKASYLQPPGSPLPADLKSLVRSSLDL